LVEKRKASDFIRRNVTLDNSKSPTYVKLPTKLAKPEGAYGTFSQYISTDKVQEETVFYTQAFLYFILKLSYMGCLKGTLVKVMV